MTPYCLPGKPSRPPAHSIPGSPSNWDKTSRAQRHAMRQLLDADTKARLEQIWIDDNLDADEWASFFRDEEMGDTGRWLEEWMMEHLYQEEKWQI